VAGYIIDLGGAQEGLHAGGDGADLVEYLRLSRVSWKLRWRSPT